MPTFCLLTAPEAENHAGAGRGRGHGVFNHAAGSAGRRVETPLRSTRMRGLLLDKSTSNKRALAPSARHPGSGDLRPQRVRAPLLGPTLVRWSSAVIVTFLQPPCFTRYLQRTERGAEGGFEILTSDSSLNQLCGLWVSVWG